MSNLNSSSIQVNAVLKDQNHSKYLELLKGNLIVSCQASDGEPLCHPSHILALSLSALNGGAGGLRLEGIDNIQYVKEHLEKQGLGHIPIIGLTKSKTVSKDDLLTSVYITSTFAEAQQIASAGADIIALDATSRARPDGLSLRETIENIHNKLNKLVWADCSSLDDAINASKCGADILSTTLWGYTQETYQKPDVGPNFDLLHELIQYGKCPVILEGRVWSPDEVKQAYEYGAYAVVVGSAITRPQLITKRFVNAIPQMTKA